MLLCIALLAVFAVGCAKKGDSTTAPPDGSSAPAPADQGEAPADQDYKEWLLACNNWGVGAYPLDIIFEEMGRMASAVGVKLDVANNAFTADKVISDLQNQISSKVDGVAFLSVAQPLFPTVADICKDAKLPFMFFTNAPEESALPAIMENPYFCGIVQAYQYQAGVQIAEMALADGMKTAILSGAAIGDYAHDQRMAGFKATFEAGGGKVLYTSHAADPSEGTQKANDFITAYPDADMVYCTGGDFVSALLSAMESRSDVNYAVYGTDVSPDLAQQILDKGTIRALNGLQYGEGAIGATLVINYLDGHQILDENGKPPIFNHLEMVVIDKSNAQQYIDLMNSTGEIITADEYRSLLYRYNPDVDYQTYYDFIANYNEMVSAKLK
jgi:ribose transport system substrate-binding protein